MNNNYSEKFEKMRLPGISTNKIDQLCFEYIRDNGGYSAPLHYRGYTKSLCTSLNHVVCHGIPSDRVLNEGDFLNIDVTAIVNDIMETQVECSL